jgi:hypothetical protein
MPSSQIAILSAGDRQGTSGMRRVCYRICDSSIQLGSSAHVRRSSALARPSRVPWGEPTSL